MAAPQSKGEAQKLLFGPWLVDAINSGSYQGLCWIDSKRSTFRVPWKHIARKDVTSSDVEIFRAWAEASGRYEGCPDDPTKWKTNFRCALRSTHKFILMDDRSKCGDDPHKVFAIVPATPWQSEKGGFSSLDPVADQQPLHQQPQPELNLQDVAPEIPPTGSADPPQSMILEDMEILQWVLEHCDISPRDLGPPESSWAPAGDAPHQDILLQPHPEPAQTNGLLQWAPTVDQLPLDAYRPLDPMLLGQEIGPVPLPCHPPDVTVPGPTPEEMKRFVPAARPVPPPPLPLEDNRDDIDPSLDVSIFYRGRLFHQEEVRVSRCLLAYQLLDPAVAQRPGHLVCFPSPAKLADGKQRQYTEELLHVAGLQLEQRAYKIFATRLKKCRVFWALSQQLEGIEVPPANMLCRNQETPIFDFNEFCTELRDFRNGHRKRSPDFTIYLCFGQCFSNTKPKESKLILVKLVPKFCEYWYEQVLQGGASSLNSSTISLQLSDTFSLFELIEQYNMQVD